jgi:hypothetical protein
LAPLPGLQKTVEIKRYGKPVVDPCHKIRQILHWLKMWSETKEPTGIDL